MQWGQSQRACGVTQGVGPEFKPQYHKKKKLSIFFWAGVWPMVECLAGISGDPDSSTAKKNYPKIKDLKVLKECAMYLRMSAQSDQH
jgi:hypothetical protein